MRAVYKQPGHVPEIIDLDNELVPIQGFIGGYIETVPLDGDFLLICNEEGKLLGLEPNIFLISGTYVDEIVGPILVVKNNGEEFGELTEEEANEVCSIVGGSGIWRLK
ncbi:MAG: DUF3846 domain-containing protein [Bacteroidales bacterium]|nr:DUF3846 domain-containing protein [Bacteroidales bacterium]